MTDAPIGIRAYMATGAALQTAFSPRSLGSAVSAIWRRHHDLLANAGSLIGATAVTSALGFTFWTLAAREFSQQAVGYGSAAVSAMSVLATIGIFGLGTVLIGELPRRNPRAGLVSAALLASGLGSLVLAIGFVVIAPVVSKRFGDMLGSPFEALLFTLGVALGGMAAVFDQATIGLLRGGVQLSRNFVFAVAKMAALPIAAVLLHDRFGIGIPMAWNAGSVISLLTCAIWLRIRGSPVLPRPDWGVLRALGKTAVAHNWLNIAIAVPTLMIPVVVTIVVSPTANAAFYVAWMLATFLYAVPNHLATVLFAIAAAEPHLIPEKLRFALKVSLLVGVPGILALCLGAHLVLGLFGVNYVREATFPLWILCFAFIPGLPKSFYIAVCRAMGKVPRAAVVLTTFSALELVSAGVGGKVDGLKGLSFAILAMTLIEGLVTTPAVFWTITDNGRHRRGISSDSAVPLSSLGAPVEGTRNSGPVANPARLRNRPAGCTEIRCACTSVQDCTAITGRHPEKKSEQEAGINALIWIARSTAPTVPFPMIQVGASPAMPFPVVPDKPRHAEP